MNPHTQSANAGTIRQCVTTEGVSLHGGQTHTLIMNRQNTFTTAPYVQEKRSWQHQEITYPCQKIIGNLFCHLGLQQQ